MSKLECEILDIINETIEGKYIGKLRVIKEDNVYCLQMFLNLTVAPAFSLIKECKDENDFKEFVRKEIKSRKIEKESFWKVSISYDTGEDLIDKKQNKIRMI